MRPREPIFPDHQAQAAAQLQAGVVPPQPAPDEVGSPVLPQAVSSPTGLGRATQGPITLVSSADESVSCVQIEVGSPQLLRGPGGSSTPPQEIPQNSGIQPCIAACSSGTRYQSPPRVVAPPSAGRPAPPPPLRPVQGGPLHRHPLVLGPRRSPRWRSIATGQAPPMPRTLFISSSSRERR